MSLKITLIKILSSANLEYRNGWRTIEEVTKVLEVKFRYRYADQTVRQSLYELSRANKIERLYDFRVPAKEQLFKSEGAD